MTCDPIVPEAGQQCNQQTVCCDNTSFVRSLASHCLRQPLTVYSSKESSRWDACLSTFRYECCDLTGGLSWALDKRHTNYSTCTLLLPLASRCARTVIPSSGYSTRDMIYSVRTSLVESERQASSVAHAGQTQGKGDSGVAPVGEYVSMRHARVGVRRALLFQPALGSHRRRLPRG